MKHTNNKKPQREPTLSEIEGFSYAVDAELEAVKVIAEILHPYCGRVRGRVLAHAQELLDFVDWQETKP